MKKEKNLVPQSLSTLVPSREKAAFTLAEGATHVAPSKACRRGGFTLAEVLITLAIVGVVAALTMPSIINDFRTRDLQARFKKADALISQALNMTAVELGLGNYKELRSLNENMFWSSSTEVFNAHMEEVNKIFLKQFAGGVEKAPSSSSKYRDIYRFEAYADTRQHVNSGYYFYSGGYLLKNGMWISKLVKGVPSNFYSEKVAFDINGPFKGPNRDGYDVFNHTIDAYYLNRCNPLLTHTSNFDGCLNWARLDQNPLDTSKSYWKSLYKPVSYWENLNQ